MSQSRRRFLGQTLATASAAVTATNLSPLFGAPRSAGRRILILGGTGFLGPKTVEAALARGHHVTVFNRGKTEKRIPFEYREVEHLYGNRDPLLPADDERGPDGKLLRPDASPKGLEQLEGKKFDVVIDNSGYYPRMVKASAELLAKNAGMYIFISSISAYASNDKPGADEGMPVATLADPAVETMGPNSEHYGGLKALCEQAAQAAFPGKAAIVRPGYIVGPGDPTDRFTYWPVRVQRGGEVLAPGAAADPVQWIDVRDLAEWLVKLAEDGTAGTFNAVGPAQPAKWGETLQACVQASGGKATLTWVPAEWLTEHAGEDFFPIWVPPTGEYAGFHQWSNDRAKKAGLRFRPVRDTIEGLLAWFPAEIERRKRVTEQMIADAKAKGQDAPRTGDPAALRAGPAPEREQELLAAWKAEKR
ncbi:MAG: NAD-dependent epimerase/dehydratase family protein [Planctomycetota bacterium]|nr:MAG: NAD-dependent epimerase/dehydratase family protein [Planctomycetota bacterium]